MSMWSGPVCGSCLRLAQSNDLVEIFIGNPAPHHRRMLGRRRVCGFHVHILSVVP